MGKLKKLIASLSIAAISLVSVVSTAFGAFSDTSGHWSQMYVDAATANGVFQGYPDGTFKPDQAMTRAEVAATVARALDLELGDGAALTFVDVPADHWGKEEIEAVEKAGIMTGDDTGNTFRPNATMNRAELAAVITRAWKLEEMMTSTFSDVPADAWYNKYVGAVEADGAVSGYKNADGSLTGMFGPNDDVTRGQVAKVVSVVAGFEVENPTTCEDGMVKNSEGVCVPMETEEDCEEGEVLEGGLCVPEDDFVAGGELMVKAGTMPVGVDLPKGATSVKMFTFDLTAGSQGVRVNDVDLKQYGVANVASDHGVYLYEGGNRLTSAKNLNSTTNRVSFRNLDLQIEAGQTRTLTVRMDVGTTTETGLVGFELEGPESFDVDGTVADFTGFQGSLFGLTTVQGGSVTIEKNGTLSGEETVGAKGAVASKTKLIAGSQEAVYVQELGFYVDGTIDTRDVRNFKLYVSGQEDPIATVDQVNSSDVATFMIEGEDGEGLFVDKGATKTMWVEVDYETGRSNDTVLVYIDETADVYAKGTKYEGDFGVSVVTTAYDGTECTATTPTDCSATTLEGGDFTLSGHSISNRNVAIDDDDVVLLRFTMTAMTEGTMDDIVVFLDTDAAGDGLLDANLAANYTDIHLREVGGGFATSAVDADVFKTTAGGTTAIGGANDTNAAYYTFTDEIEFEAGDTRQFELVVDVANKAALADDRIKAGFYIDATRPTLKDDRNKTLTNADALVPTSSYTGNEFTVKADQINVSRSTAVGSDTTVIGSTASLFAFNVTAGQANDLRLEEIDLTGYVDANNGNADFVAGSDSDFNGLTTVTNTYQEIVLSHDLYVGSVTEENKLNGTSESASSAGVIKFTDLDLDLEAGETKVLYVVGKFANDSSYNAKRVKVDVARVSGDTLREDSDGNTVVGNTVEAASLSPNGGTTNDAATYTQITLSAGGNLTVSVPSNRKGSQIVVAGKADELFTPLRLTSTEETMEVRRLTLRNTFLTTFGDYDDNIAQLEVEYPTNLAGDEMATATCARVTAGVYYECTLGTPMIVPEPDLGGGVKDYAELNVKADLNPKTNLGGAVGAKLGDKPAFTLALYDFEAYGESDKLIEENGTNGLLVSGVSVANFVDDTDLAADATAVATEIQVADNDNLVAGSMICVDEDDGGACEADEEQMYVLYRCTAADTPVDACTGDNYVIVKRGVNGTTAAVHSNGDDIRLLTAASVLTTNYMQVQDADLELALVGAGTKNGAPDTQETVLEFTVTPVSGGGDARVRAGQQEAAEAFGDASLSAVEANLVLSNESTIVVQGTNSLKAAYAAGGDNAVADDTAIYYPFDNGTDASDYTRVSFWLQWHDEGGASALPVEDLLFAYDDNDAGVPTETQAFGTGSLTEDTWYFFDIAVPAAAINNSRGFFGLELEDASTLFDATAGNAIYLDDIRFYNEKINVDLTLNEAWGSVLPRDAYLLQDNNIVATTDSYHTGTSGQIQFVPVGVYGEIEFDEASTFKVQMDTSNTIADAADATENLTAKIDLGNVTTNGDFWWNDYEDLIKFLGVASTDKISQTNRY